MKKKHVANFADYENGANLIIVLRTVNSERQKNFERAYCKLFAYIQEKVKPKPKEHNEGFRSDLSKPLMQKIINLNNLAEFLKDPIKFYLDE